MVIHFSESPLVPARKKKRMDASWDKMWRRRPKRKKKTLLESVWKAVAGGR